MIKARRMLSILGGNAPASMWVQAAHEEPPVNGRPKACDACPMRRGGEWEEGATAALADMGSGARKMVAERWGCHAGPRPCAGMRRLVSDANVKGLDEAGVTIDQVGAAIRQFDKLADAAGGPENALAMMEEGQMKNDLMVATLTRDTARRIHAELRALADGYVYSPWRVVDINVGCSVRDMLSDRGSDWTIEVRCRSDGGASRHFWFKGHTLVDVVNLAKRTMRGEWQGWEIFE